LKITGKILAAFGMPLAILRIAVGKLAGRLEIPYFDCVISTRCTLHCKECSNLMQYYGKHLKNSYDVAVKDLKADMIKLLQAVDYIQIMVIIGGEPFLHKHLDDILEFLIDKEKIGHVQIITNGTTMPEKNVINICGKSKKITVLISDYGTVSNKREKLVSTLQENNVRFTVLRPGYWRIDGGIDSRNRSQQELIRTFRSCRIGNCRSLLNGEMHLCPRSSAGTDLGIIPRRESDYVSVRKEDNIKNIRRNLTELLKKHDYILACNYCDNSNNFPLVKVTVGEQGN